MSTSIHFESNEIGTVTISRQHTLDMFICGLAELPISTKKLIINKGLIFDRLKYQYTHKLRLPKSITELVFPVRFANLSSLKIFEHIQKLTVLPSTLQALWYSNISLSNISKVDIVEYQSDSTTQLPSTERIDTSLLTSLIKEYPNIVLSISKKYPNNVLIKLEKFDESYRQYVLLLDNELIASITIVKGVSNVPEWYYRHTWNIKEINCSIPRQGYGSLLLHHVFSDMNCVFTVTSISDQSDRFFKKHGMTDGHIWCYQRCRCYTD